MTSWELGDSQWLVAGGCVWGNMNLLRFGDISDTLRGTSLVSVSEQEKQHSSRLDQNNPFTSAHPPS